MPNQLTLGSLFDGIGGWQIAAVRNGVKPIWSSEIEEYPMEVTKYHFPDTIQLGDITKIDGAKIPPVDIVCAGSPCFKAGTMVVTDKGVKPIETIDIGDNVITHNNEWHVVTDVMQHRSRNIYNVKPEGTLATTVTANHPYYVRHMSRVWDNAKKQNVRVFSEPKWVEVKDLTKEDFIGYPINQVEENPLNLSKTDCWLLGRYVADGYLNNSPRAGREGQYNHKVIYCVGVGKDETFTANLGEYHACRKQTRTVTKYEICNERLMRLCKLCGRGAENKEIPTFIYNLPVPLLDSFLQGYISGDGSYIKDKDIFTMTTVSVKLAIGLQAAVHKAYRVPCSVQFSKMPKTCVIEGRVCNQRDFYTIRFQPVIKKQTHAYIDGNIVWRQIRKLEKLDGAETVYNIEVDENHSYTANGVIVHNCQDLSLAGKREGLKGERSGLFRKAVDIVRQMRTATNGEYPKWFVWENVPGAFSSNKGLDFKAVLEEISEAEIPMPKSGRWAPAGMVRSGKCDICWRVLDAQYWGVPQRRKRIFLIADFRDERRAEVLFEPESECRNTSESTEQGKGTAEGTERCTGETGSSNSCLTPWDVQSNRVQSENGTAACGETNTSGPKVITRANQPTDIDTSNPYTNVQTLFQPKAWDGQQTCSTLTAHNANGSQRMPDKQHFNCVLEPKVYGICSYESNSMKSDNPNSGIYIADTSRTLDLNGGNPACNQGGMAVVESKLASGKQTIGSLQATQGQKMLFG